MLRYCRHALANMTTTYLTFWMHDNYLGNAEWKEYETSLPPSHNQQVRDGANVHFLTGSVALQIAVVCMKDASLSATLQAFVKLWKIQHKLLQQVGIFHVNYRWPKQSQRVFWCSTIATTNMMSQYLAGMTWQGSNYVTYMLIWKCFLLYLNHFSEGLPC